MGKFYTKPVCFKCSKVWFNNGIYRSKVCLFVPPLNFSSVEIEILDAEISKLISKGVTVNTTRGSNDYVCGISMRTKKRW